MSATAPEDSTAHGRGAITPAAESVLAFVNTRADAGGRQELLGDAEAFATWLAEHDQFGGPTALTDADAAAARELRDALVTVMLAHSGDPDYLGEPLHAAESHLQRAGTLYPLAAVITGQGARLTSPQTGAAHVLGTVIAAATEFAQNGEWGRIKACRNPPCHFGFFDRSRNSSGLYCSSACSAQVSMRKYRQRQRSSS
ncbi:CGNR zinc finger domain-containing protein [Mycolicibacterium sp. Dal123E01]|uniref:CGNR zinc finger domain-containing protein n=1 Tax=Mycolicibacterium sp. Dal123E01 TaxID=3457578 RepID=UPI00403E9FDA